MISEYITTVGSALAVIVTVIWKLNGVVNKDDCIRRHDGMTNWMQRMEDKQEQIRESQTKMRESLAKMNGEKWKS